MPFFSPTITTGNTDTIGNRKRDDDSNYTVGSNNTVDSFVTGVGRNAPDRGDEIYMGLIRSGALASTPLGLAVIPNSIDEIISLGQDARRGEELAKDRYKRVIPFVHSSLTVGRRLDRAVVLVVGSTRQGKSKTINRLVGKALLKVGQTSSGSTTKVVQRISVPSPSPETGVNITLSFDDTPGLEDTTYADRERNAILMRRYGKKHYPTMDASRMKEILNIPTHDFRDRTYPNAILLVASWDTIIEDAHNNPIHFSSPIGKTIRYLKGSNLTDDQHQNVIVVVTKALTFWDDYEDCDSEDEKCKQWELDAADKVKIINDLRSKVFPSSGSWRVVFVENGGGAAKSRQYKMLPNGELSHQNLFQAIYDLVTAHHTATARDLVGIQALRLLTGEDSLVTQLEASTPEILVQLEGLEAIPEQERVDAGFISSNSDGDTVPSSTASPSFGYLREMAKNRLGFVYNPIYKSFGRTRVVVSEESDIKIEKDSSRQLEGIIYTTEAEEHNRFTANQLRADFEIPSIVSFGAHYSSSSTAGSSASAMSRRFKATKVTAIATLTMLVPTLSDGMRQEIAALPRWGESSEVQARYRRFFVMFGTHVNVRAVFGGVLRIVVRGDSKLEEETVRRALGGNADVPVATHIGAKVGMQAKRDKNDDHYKGAGERLITVDRDGGRVVASQLTGALEELFAYLLQVSPDSPAPQKWIDVRTRWVEALEDDSVFCADDPETQYLWLYSLKGLTETEQWDLQRASEWYLRNPVEEPLHSTAILAEATSIAAPKHSKGHLPRRGNLEQVDNTLRGAKASWSMRFRKLLFGWRMGDS